MDFNKKLYLAINGDISSILHLGQIFQTIDFNKIQASKISQIYIAIEKLDKNCNSKCGEHLFENLEELTAPEILEIVQVILKEFSTMLTTFSKNIDVIINDIIESDGN